MVGWTAHLSLMVGWRIRRTKSSIIIEALRAFRVAIMVDLGAWRIGVSEATQLRCLAKLSGLRTGMVFDRLRITT